jgi:hypothetical protein
MLQRPEISYSSPLARSDNKDIGSQFAGKVSVRPPTSPWVDKNEWEARSGQKQAFCCLINDLNHNQGGAYSPTEGF